MLRVFLLSICFALCTVNLSVGQGACSAPPNPIVAENCKTGTTEWAVSGLGDLTIQGFSTDISVNAGQTIFFKIQTPATSFHVDIYRLGYYGGTGGRYITTLQPSVTLPQIQPACKTDPATQLYDCGNWAVSAKWAVPADAMSGVYIAAPVRGDTSGASQIVFIVRNDSSHSAILFQTSDESWQAYNGFGGASVYGPTNSFDLTNRALKVSYNRPSATRTFSFEEATWVFGEEYPMIRWLEANGYDVTYFTGVDAARNGSLITNHKLYLSVGHDEYWSGPQRTNVEAARDAGVNMAFFSGNEVFWKTRWENSIDGTNTPYRTLVCYKEGLGPNSVPPAKTFVDPLDPPVWTGTWRDPQKSPPADGGRPENSLTGTIFMVNGPGTDNPGNLSIKVPSADGKMRFWRNTTVANLAAGQTATLPIGTLGYEWDEDLDNGARPAGTFDLSTATYNLTEDFLLDQGGTYGAGTATHHMTLHRAPSGALVFGAGSVQYAWGLDSNHDNPFSFTTPAANPDMQQATVNLFADMGVQPATLQAGLITALMSTDTVAPSSTFRSPANGATIPFGTQVTITGTAADVGGGVVGGVEVSVDGGATWHPATGRESWSYIWTALTPGSFHILSRAVDDSGNLETPNAGLNVVVPTPPISTDQQVTHDNSTPSTSIASPAFSTTAGNELLLAFIGADYLSGTNTTVTNVTGGGLTWTLVVRTNVQSGTSEIWRAFATSPVSNVTVTATLSQSVVSSITVMSFEGVNTGGTNGSGAVGAVASANAKTGAPTASLVTTGTYSRVFGVGNDFDDAVARTPGANQSVVHQFLSPAGDTYWVQMENGVTVNSGTTVTINDTAPTTDRWNLSLVEIRSAPTGSLSISGNISPVSIGSGALVTLAGVVNTTVNADSSGNYSFTGLPSGSYTIMPSQTNTLFTPASQPISLTANVTGVNFTGVQSFSISGSITPATVGNGTLLTLSGAGGGTVTANASGNYTFTGLANGTYTITPSKSGVTFTPPSQTVTISGGSLTAVNFSVPSWTLSGNVSTSGASATVALSGTATATTTADSSGNYSFPGLLNGSYTVTPTKSGYSFTPPSQTATINSANTTGINFTAQVAASGTLAIDAKLSFDGSSASSSITTPAFSTLSANELLLAFVTTDYLSGANTTVTGMSGGGLTWTLVVRTNVQSGGSEIWRAFATSPLTNVTATATLSQSIVSSITIMSFTGVDTTGTNGSGAIGATASANAKPGAPSATLFTTRNNSWVFGVGNDYDNALARTAGAGQTLVHQDLTSAGDTYWVQMQNSPTLLSGTSVSINDTAPTGDRYNLSAVEVLPSTGPTYSITGNISPASIGSGSTVKLSGSATSSAVADSSGNYAFNGLSNGSYTVTPSKTGVTFTPSSQPVTINGASVPNVNFTIVQPILSITPMGVAFSAVQGNNPSPATISIANTGGSTLSYSLTSDSAWLTATPTSGTAPQNVQVSASATGLNPGTYAGHLTITSAGAVGSPAIVNVNLNVTVQGDWLMIEHDVRRTGIASDETSISPANVANLQLKWSKTVDGSVTTQPLYAHSVQIAGQSRDIVMVGTAANTLFALDATTGATIWSRNFGVTTPNNWAIPDGFGIEAPPVIDRTNNRVYTVSTDGMFRTLSLIDGTDAATAFALVTNPITNKVWGGLNKLNNNVYVVTASNGGDVNPWRGQTYQVDVSATPTLAGDFVVVPSIPAPNGGGGIWGYGGASIDPTTGNVYVTSADDSNVSSGGTEGYTPYSNSMIALNANVGLLGYYQAQQPTNYGCSDSPCDLDYAATPLVFQPAGCPTMLAAGNKNGNLYLFRATDLAMSGQPLQILTLNVADDSLGSGGIGGTPVYSPITNMLYITDAGPGVSGVSAGIVGMTVNANCTLQVAWSHPLSGNDFPNSTPTLANGVLFVGEGSTGIIHSYNAQTGAALWTSGSQLNAASTFAGPTVANGVVYVGSWTSYSGGGIVGAFALNSPTLSVSPSSASFNATFGGSNPAPATANVTNAGSGTLAFTAASDSAWLTVSPTSGTAPQSLQLSASIAGLAVGTYTGHITVTSNGSVGSPATITATLNVTSSSGWTISGNVSTNGAGASVALTGTSTSTVTADGSGNYSFPGLANGSYTVTPTKSGYTFNPTSTNVTVNGANMSGVNFTATPVSGSGLSIDARVSVDSTAASKTIASPAITTTAGNELLLAFISTDYLSGTNTTVTGIAGGGLTWTLVVRTNVQSGGAEIWRAFATSPVSSATVTATISQSVLSSMTVISFKGVDTTGTNGSGAIGATGTFNANPGAPTGSLVTTHNNSWVFGVGNDYDNAIARTAGAGQTLIHQDLTSTGDTYWVQMQNSPTPLSGTSVTINDTAPTADRYNLSLVEVRTP